ADGYLFNSQFYFMTELLDAGIRVFEWDVHLTAEGGNLSTTGFVPELCHAEADHVTCHPADRDAVNAIKELRGWMREPANLKEVVFISVENRMDIGSVKFTNAVAVFLENVPGIGVFTPAEFQAFGNALTGTFEHTSHFNGRTYRREWPSQEYLVDTGNRVVFIGNVPSTDIFLSGYVHDGGANAFLSVGEYIPTGLGVGDPIDVWQNKNNAHQADFPDCTVPHVVDGTEYTLRLNPMSGVFAGMFSDDVFFGAGEITADDIAGLTKCNLDHIGFDNILHPSRADTIPRLEAAVWSWVKDQPPETAAAGTLAAWLSHTTGRWGTDAPSAQRRHLCRQEGVEPDLVRAAGSFVKNIPKTTWSLTADAGEFSEGLAACAALPVSAGAAPWKFLPPLNGYENALAYEAAQADGFDPWVNFIAAGNDHWQTLSPEIRILDDPPFYE
ncbi:MAG: hypothetical protein ACREA0_20785, partial [bacterium]